MLSRLRKKTEANAASQVPPWHPNFRNYERLPDIKVVRTAFFVNGLAIFVVIGLLVILGKREYELHSLNAQIADWQRQIDRDKAANDQAVAAYRKFQEEEKRANAIDAFVHSKPIVSEYVVHFAEARPKNIAWDVFDLRETGIILRGSVRGAPDLAAGEASAYLDVLKNDKTFGSRFADVQMTSLNRNPSTNRMVFEIVIKFKPAGKGGKS
jgi:hypothetical protein